MSAKKSNFFADQLRESVGGKFSSKKIWGFTIMFLVCASFILDGTKIYKANETLFFYMLCTGATLLGLRGVTKMVSGLRSK